MSSLLDKVKSSLKWKKNAEYCAEKLEITVDDYETLKGIIKTKDIVEEPLDSCIESSYDLDKGEARISIVSSEEPKSPEEIIKILNIDTTQWKLSQYWNKQKGERWVVSALVTKIKLTEVDSIEGLLKGFTPKPYKAVTRLNTPGKTKTAGVLSLQDIHFGKEGNETIDKDFEETIKDLIHRSTTTHHLEKLYYVIGGDLINMDTWLGTTTQVRLWATVRPLQTLICRLLMLFNGALTI